MIPHIKNLVNKSMGWCMDILFPKFCFGCRKESAYLCADCKNKIQINHFLFCPVCKNKLIDKKCARKCKSQIEIALSPFSYDGFLIKDLIHNFKYNFIKDIGPELAAFMDKSIKSSQLINLKMCKLKNFLIIPVPLHRRRLAWRGFNQSEILAKEISKTLNIEFQSALKRIKNTKPQIEMASADERQENIRGAFAVKTAKFPISKLLISKKLNYQNLKNKTIILVDDMITTGATLEECAKVLKQNGAKEIWALTIAK